MLEALASRAPTPPSTYGPTSGGSRGGVQQRRGSCTPGGPGGPKGWAKLENLLGSCPHHAALWSQGQAHSHFRNIEAPPSPGWEGGRD